MIKKRITSIASAFISLLIGIFISFNLVAMPLEPTDIPTLFFNHAKGHYEDVSGSYRLQGELLDLGGGFGSVGADLTVEQVAENIAKRLQVKPTLVEKTPLEGIYIAVFGDLPKYVESSGRFLFRGATLTDANGNDFAETVMGKAKQAEQQQNLALLNKTLDEQDLLIYQAEQGNGQHITVFTDVDCPFCQRLHQDVPLYLQAGISVRYILFPRSGQHSASYGKAISVWCSDEPLMVLDKAESGMNIPRARCDHPIDRFLNIGRAFNLLGTPAMMLQDGQILHGYHQFDEVMRLVKAN